MPWVTVGNAKLCPFEDAALFTGHDACASLPLFADMTQPPDVALSVRLPSSTPEAVRQLLFFDLSTLNNDDDDDDDNTVVNNFKQVVDDVRALIVSGHVVEPRTWNPYTIDVVVGHDALKYKVYSALVLRVNILSAYCDGLRDRQERRAAANATSGSSRQRLAAQRTVPLDELDAMAYYMYLWLDAHLLLCTTIEQLGMAPRDGHAWTTAILKAYAPSAATVFHEGELPDLVARIESCSFFSDAPAAASKRRDAITHMLSKSIPHRCVVRDVISIIETACVADDGVVHLFAALIAASLLGIYRHARLRPHFSERLQIYQALFFEPPDEVVRTLDEAQRSRGVTSAPYRRRQESAVMLPPTSVDVELGDYASQRRSAGLPDNAIDSNVSERDWLRRERVYAFLAAASTATATRRFVNQNTVVNVVREYLVFAIERFVPHLHQELATRTEWVQWHGTVVQCMDAMRCKPAGISIFKTVDSSLLPSKTLYQVERESFTAALASACTTFLDSGQGITNAPDGSERALDAAFSADVEHVLRVLVDWYPTTSKPLLPVTQCPVDERDFHDNFVPFGRVPLVMLHATPAVVREYRAAYANYQRAPSPAVTTGFVRYLIKDASLYQLMLVREFALAQIDRSRIYAFPLSKHLADKQASVMRERLQIDDNEPLPLHLLTSFVCRRCREFRGALIDENADATTELPMFGSELVAMTTTPIEAQVATNLERRGFPQWSELVTEARDAGTSLFDWFRAKATIDGDTNVFPTDPVVFNAPDNATDVCEAWLESRPHTTFSVADYPITKTPNPAAAAAAADTDVSVIIDLENLQTPSFERNNVFEQFQMRWAALNRRPFVVGHRSNDSRDEVIVWTCASKRYKAEERKIHQTGAAMQKVEDSITPQQRTSALRSANQKRRHDMRCYHLYSLCSRTHLLAVSLLGYAVRVDRHIIMACCVCLGYTRLSNAHWYDDTLLCTRCWKRSKQGVVGSMGVFGLSTSVKCLHCRSVRKPGDVFYATPVYDDVINRFVTIYLCDAHAKKKSWLFGSPNYHALTTVNVGIRARWGTLRSWDSTRDYARNVVAFARVGANEADDHDMARDEEAEEREVMRRARRLLGTRALDDDGDDNDNDGDDDDDDDDKSEDDGKKKKKTVVRRRRVGADRVVK